MSRILARIRGRVQGVCFRHHTRLQAMRLGLRGWVRNLPDGSVEALIEGDEAAVRRMMQWLARGPELARVDHVDFTPTDEAAPPDFRILY